MAQYVRPGGGAETDPVASAALEAHAADTTGVHGIVNTAALVLTNDARLSDQRTPPDGSVTVAKLSFDPATQAELDAALGTLASDAELTAHVADTTAVHGIANTASLVL